MAAGADGAAVAPGAHAAPGPCWRQDTDGVQRQGHRRDPQGGPLSAGHIHHPAVMIAVLLAGI
jgi:hypothetical protein